jgi:hypothetical protein
MVEYSNTVMPSSCTATHTSSLPPGDVFVCSRIQTDTISTQNILYYIWLGECNRIQTITISTQNILYYIWFGQFYQLIEGITFV